MREPYQPLQPSRRNQSRPIRILKTKAQCCCWCALHNSYPSHKPSTPYTQSRVYSKLVGLVGVLVARLLGAVANGRFVYVPNTFFCLSQGSAIIVFFLSFPFLPFPSFIFFFCCWFLFQLPRVFFVRMRIVGAGWLVSGYCSPHSPCWPAHVFAYYACVLYNHKLIYVFAYKVPMRVEVHPCFFGGSSFLGAQDLSQKPIWRK